MAKEIVAKSKIKHYTRGTDHLFMVIVYAFCAISLIAIIIPLIFVVAASFSSPDALLSAKVFLWPVDFTLRGYKMVFDHDLLPRSFWNSIVYTVVGTTINLVLTVLAAYPLSRKDLAVRNPVMMLFAFTMLFNGGMIPTYMVIRNIGMVDTIWALVVPGALSVFNIILMRTSMQEISDSLEEAARLDGANDFVIMFKIVLPLCKATFAVIMLFTIVMKWNDYMSALLYLPTKTELYPLQMELRKILFQSTKEITSASDVSSSTVYARNVEYGAIVISTLPILCVYPFVQKYFVTGMTIGAVKA